MRRHRAASILGVLAMLGCGDRAPNAQASKEVAPDKRAEELLALESPSREELVNASEALGIASTRAEPGEMSRLSKLAGDVRARAFRIAHLEADARAALALYAHAAESKGKQACEAAVEHAALETELAHDPGIFHRRAPAIAREFPDSSCARALETKLGFLEAFRPDEGAAPEPMAPSPDPGVGAGAKLLSVDPYGSPDRARVVLTLDAEARFQVGSTEEGEGGRRVFVDLERTSASPRDIEVGGIVQRVRLAPRGEGTRVVLDLASAAHHRVFFLPEPFRVVIDIATQGPSKLAAPQGAPRSVRRVAIDPGHGGNDPGAIGPAGLKEKDVTLDIAHRVAPLLARELGVLTLLTRDDDRYVALAERTARANAFHADLFVSIHCNASEGHGARGVMTFFLDTTRDEAVAKIAARENATSVAANLRLPEMDAVLEPLELGKRSRHLAGLLERTTMASLTPHWADTTSHGAKAAGFFVLVGAEMPSVLFETSFISHPVEETRLATPAYRQKLADAIVNAVRAYREGR